MTSHSLMIQGTTSDAGKSIMVAGLCRVLKNRGIHVAPFKPQNMALNSAVTADGGEIGRAQAVQAQACGIEPHTDMNPVLLKPNTDMGSQVIIQGKALRDMDAKTFHKYKATAMEAVLASHKRLSQQYDVVLVEGAGSPAEINLREHDIANMGFAEAVNCPVLLISDINRGGVFAHLVGTLALLSHSEQQRIKGFIINRFRGDIALLKPGLDWLENKTQKSVLGVLPYLHNLHIEAEDAINLNRCDKANTVINIIVPMLPRISNHTDFDVLRLHPQVNFQYVRQDEPIPACDLVILPGSKSVRPDLQWLHQNHWPDYLKKHARYGGKILGICGGFQMLGEQIHDPAGIEGPAGSSAGLAYLQLQTHLKKDKKLCRKSGKLWLSDSAVSGYEIHAGVSEGEALSSPAITINTSNGKTEYDGAVSADQQIMGTYFHGLLDKKEACDAILKWAGLTQPESPDYFALKEQQIERLASCFEEHLDINAILKLLQI